MGLPCLIAPANILAGREAGCFFKYQSFRLYAKNIDQSDGIGKILQAIAQALYCFCVAANGNQRVPAGPVLTSFGHQPIHYLTLSFKRPVFYRLF